MHLCLFPPVNTERLPPKDTQLSTYSPFCLPTTAPDSRSNQAHVTFLEVHCGGSHSTSHIPYPWYLSHTMLSSLINATWQPKGTLTRWALSSPSHRRRNSDSERTGARPKWRDVSHDGPQETSTLSPRPAASPMSEPQWRQLHNFTAMNLKVNVPTK